MQYSKLWLAALPLVAAAPLPDDYDVVYTTLYTTVVGAAPTVDAAAAIETTVYFNQYQSVQENAAAGSVLTTTIVVNPSVPSVVNTPSVVAPANTATTTTSASSSGSTGAGGSSSGGCPADTSGQYISNGINGNPSLSMLDSVNRIRRMYNANAHCLGWSDTLASASIDCVNAGTEDLLRANSQIVSDTGYGSGYFDGELATTEFEQSVFVLLCQSPSDPELKGQCPGKVGETGCSSGSCTGHHDAVVDAAGAHKFMGSAVNAGTKWMSLSFATTDGVF